MDSEGDLVKQTADLNKKLNQTTQNIDDTMQVLIDQAKAQRRYALLQSATAILAARPTVELPFIPLAVSYAEELLAEIERREKL